MFVYGILVSVNGIYLVNDIKTVSEPVWPSGKALGW